MKKRLSVSFRSANQEKIDFDLPTVCPHCGQTMIPITHSTYTHGNLEDKSSIVGIFCQCANSSCSKFYSLSFKIEPKKNQYKSIVGWDSQYIEYSYKPPFIVELPENIEHVSSNFVEIYSQAVEAEMHKLDQIAGVGYRKSAEFLIKDYVIRIKPTDEEKVKNTLLGQVIKKYLNDFPKIQTLATAVTWIGNDETHYERRHNTKDIQDLKRFIRAAAQFIAADYDVDDALEFTSES